MLWWADSLGHHFFQLKCCFRGQLAIGDISTHRPNFAPPFTPPARVYYKGAATEKKRWETIACRWFFSSSTHLFFQLNCYFWCERVNRDITSHRRIFDPPPPSPARVYLHRAAMQKNGEFLFRIDFLLWFSLTIFSIKMLSRSPTRDVGYLRPQTGYCPAADTTPSCHSIWSGATKRTVSFCLESIFTVIFTHHFLN